MKANLTSIEIHPWGTFPESPKDRKNLLLGSFPPNKFTVRREFFHEGIDMNFFYGSVSNSFWSLFQHAFGLTFELPSDLPKLKEWIENNHWVFADIVLKTERVKDSAADKDLRVQAWNSSTISKILQENTIERIYFTSIWVMDKFKDLELNGLDLGAQKILLISPSKQSCINMGRSRYLHLLPKGENESCLEYKKRYYATFLNPGF